MILPIAEEQGTEIFFLCRQFPFHTGTSNQDPRDCKCFPLKTVCFVPRINLRHFSGSLILNREGVKRRVNTVFTMVPEYRNNITLTA